MRTVFETQDFTEVHILPSHGKIEVRLDDPGATQYCVAILTTKEARKMRLLLTRAIREAEALK